VAEQLKNVIFDVASRWIFLMGLLEKDSTASAFDKALQQILHGDDDAPIVIFINSEGGCFEDCLEIYQSICRHNSKRRSLIFTVGVQFVSSSAFFLLQAGESRFAAYKTKLVFHRACKVLQNFTAVLRIPDLLDTLWDLLTHDAMAGLMFTDRGRPRGEVLDLFKREAVLSVREAKKLCLIDGIVQDGSTKDMHQRVLRQIARMKE